MLMQPQLDADTPWQQRFRAARIFYSRLAKAAPSRGLVMGNMSGRYQLYDWDVPTGELRQITHDPIGKSFGYIQPDGRYIYYLSDHEGNELGHYVRLPFGGEEEQDLTPTLPAYSSFGIAASRAGNLLCVSVAEEGGEGMHLYALELSNEGEAAIGEPRRLHSSSNINGDPVISNNGEVIVVSTTAPGDPTHFRLLALDSHGRQLGELWDGNGTSLEPRLFSPMGDLRLLAMSNASGANRPLIWDVATGERIEFAINQLKGEVQPADWSEDGRSVLLLHSNNALHQLYRYDLENASLTRLEHPSGTYSSSYFGSRGEIIADWQDSTHPSSVIALDAQTGKFKRTVLNAGDVPPGHAWRAISFKSPNGGSMQDIQGWLALPDGEGPFPTILNTHGGPTAVTTDLFSAASQMWLDHGYAYLTINYRGSTTFGREFEEQIRGDLGHWEVEDMVAARNWLVEQGIAQPDKIILQGGSYGGYLTLMAMSKYPELWAGGLALVPVVDWKMNHEDSAGTLQAYDEMLFGGKPDEVPERFTTSSPLTYVDRISAPVLIIGGRNDTRCPARPIEIYVEQLRNLNKPIEVEWFEAGHGSMVVGQQIEQAKSQLRFAYTLLNSQTR